MKKVFILLCVVTGLIACKENENTAEYQLKEARKDVNTAKYFLKNIYKDSTYIDSVAFYINAGNKHADRAELLQARGE